MRQAGTGTRGTRPAAREPWWEQAASFISFFIYLLILKSFFLPLFIIPTGSMAATLCGAHAVHTCPNCGVEYAIGYVEQWPPGYQPVVQCPNCRWREYGGGRGTLDPRRPQPTASLPGRCGHRRATASSYTAGTSTGRSWASTT